MNALITEVDPRGKMEAFIMPFIKTKVNCAITEDQEMLLKVRMGEAV